MSSLQELHDHGQSVWIDYVRRDLLTSGELEDLVISGIRGMTSNPTIFQKAIAGTDLYDEQLRAVLSAHPHADTSTIFEKLAIEDIRHAADILTGVYEDTGRADGFVSLEVSPHLAHDTEGTISEAKRLWALVDRPNLMIKVPATPEGIPAVEELLATGINVNITLMFSLADYEAVAGAYLRGMARNPDATATSSVASFFVSRVDTKTDAALEKIGTKEALALRGTSAVANSKLAYRRFQEIFEAEPFAALAARGARPQRVLWASTSTKNPAYSDLKYVEELIGPNTVNTMPPDTIEAFEDHGTVPGDTVTHGIAEAARLIDRLADVGVDFTAITAQLQTDGVVAFADSFDDLLGALDRKMEAFR